MLVAVLVVFTAFFNGSLPAQEEKNSSLQQHVRTIERALAARSLSTVREYLNPKKTYIDILGKPASYLSVNQSIAVIESFLRQSTPVGYVKGIIREDASSAIAISTLRVKNAGGERTLKLTLGFTKNAEHSWVVNRIIIR